MSRVNDELNIVIHDGREKKISLERMVEFETKSVLEKLFQGQPVETSALLEQLGPWDLDFTDVHSWSDEIPDIHPHTARLFTIWAENHTTEEVLALVRGIFVVLPFTLSPQLEREYYFIKEDTPYYPMAVVTSMRITVNEREKLDKLLDNILEGISLNWKKLREQTIARLSKGSDIRRRYIFSFEKLVHYTFLVPSLDRDIITALQTKNYHISGVMQLLASSSLSYDEITVTEHLHVARKLLRELEGDLD